MPPRGAVLPPPAACAAVRARRPLVAARVAPSATVPMVHGRAPSRRRGGTASAARPRQHGGHGPSVRAGEPPATRAGVAPSGSQAWPRRHAWARSPGGEQAGPPAARAQRPLAARALRLGPGEPSIPWPSASCVPPLPVGAGASQGTAAVARPQPRRAGSGAAPASASARGREARLPGGAQP
jgi:hypothetical protein